VTRRARRAAVPDQRGHHIVRDTTPAELLLVDDQERVIDPAQRDRWIAVAGWDDPTVTDDRELEPL